jgi:hypothetical protein
MPSVCRRICEDGPMAGSRTRTRARLALVSVGILGASLAGCSSQPNPQAKAFCVGIRKIGPDLPYAAVAISTMNGPAASMGDAGLARASQALFTALRGDDQARTSVALAQVHAACSRLGLW